MIKDVLEKNEKATPNGADLEVLKKHFGMCFNSDGSLDLEKLKARLGDQVAISNEGYELKFLGKNYARLLTSLETTTVVVPDKKHNEKPENAKSKNVYISGDNLDALKHLLKSKQGQVKCIYIDPPYNTGSDGFVYNDSFGFKVEELANKLSISEDEAQRILDFTKRGSASHSAWLMFMYPRLMLARDLLAKDGVIFISIDDNEQANLKLMCDEIFGGENFVCTFAWQKRYSPPPDTKDVGYMHESILMYKRSDSFAMGILPFTDEQVARYQNPDHDPRGPWKAADYTCRYSATERPSLYYPIINPNTGKEVWPKETRVWANSKTTHEQNQAEGRIWWGENGTNEVPCLKNYLSEIRQGSMPTTLLFHDDVGHTDEATKELRELLPSVKFTPKPTRLLSHLFKVANISSGDIVVDFFSGSGTTAHAVMKRNLVDKTGCQYILVQWQEMCNENSEAYKSGYKTIDEIGQARIKKAAAKIAAENPLLAKTMDLGFKHYTLKDVEGKTLDKIEKFDLNDNALAATADILKEFGVETVLATWLVHDGYGFGAEPKVVDLDGYKAYWMEKHVYLIEPGLSDKGISALFDKFETEGSFNPGNVVVFGYSFSWTQLEALKNNLLKIAANGTNKHVLLDKRY